jgi:hypothetical protein
LKVDPGYGRTFGPVWRAVLSDYAAGEGHRARARLGFLTPPEGRGRVIWIKAGAGADSLRLGGELLGAVRDRRRDVRVVLTFEQDDPVLLRRLLQPWPRVGIGYGPCDRPRVVTRVLGRFQPCGIILAESAPPENLLRRTLAPVAVVGGGTVAATPVVAAWPLSTLDRERWERSGQAEELMPAADPQARFVEAQADVVLRSLAGAGARRLWWWHGTAAQWPAWLAAWQAWPASVEDILMVSLGAGESPVEATLKVSAWNRQALPGGTLLHIDDRRWHAAAASAAHGVHLAHPGRDVLWQALAAGSAVSLGTPADADGLPVPILEAPGAVVSHWLELRGEEALRRTRGDAARRRFWEERRQVDENLAVLMNRVWMW